MKRSCRLTMCVWVCSVLLVLPSWCSAKPKPYFPDLPGYKTLVCDLHTHTVFSDGTVWPTERIEEANREGLDAIALSDHIEHQPHSKDIPVNQERPYEIAAPKARQLNVLLIKGAEITKDTPPGHYNAILLDTIAPLDQPDVLDAVKAAAEQKAFVFWNHHTWKGLERGQWQDVQTTMYQNKWLHGMEVANGRTYYPLAHQWCLDKNLTMIGTSDIHGPSIDSVYTPQKHRTLTLVLAKERTTEAIGEALFAGRTLVWHDNRLIGRRPLLEAMYQACVTVLPMYYSRGDTGYFEIINRSFLDIELNRIGRHGPEHIRIPARSRIDVRIALAEIEHPHILSYAVANMLTAPETALTVDIEIALPEPVEPELDGLLTR